MESNNNTFAVGILELLPFMNLHFLNTFRQTLPKKIKVKEVKMSKMDDLPYKCLFVFEDADSQALFISSYQNKDFQGLNYSIKIEKNPASVGDCNEEKNPLPKIKFDISYNKLPFISYERSFKEPGLVVTDKDILEKQNKVVNYLMKSIGSNLLKGKSVMSISLPVNIFDKRTLLQVMAYEFSFASIFLTRAYYANNTMERLKWITVYLVATLHLSALQTKPFNPIIGETFQCTVGNLKVYLEQTEHKPVVMNFYAKDINGLYKISGFLETKASTGANNVKARKSGRYMIEFKDGHVYELTLPQVYLKGITFGKRLFNYRYAALVSDKKNNLASIIQFNPDERGAIANFFGSKQKSHCDTFRGSIIKYTDIKWNNKEKHEQQKKFTEYCKIEGEWTSHCNFDKVNYWSVDQYDLNTMRQMEFVLPSDSSHRKDLQAFVQNDEPGAQALKEQLEELQRNDRRLRETYQKQS